MKAGAVLAAATVFFFATGTIAEGSELYRELVGEGRPTIRQLALEGVLAIGGPPAAYWAIAVGLLGVLLGLSLVAYWEDLEGDRDRDWILRALLGRRLYGFIVGLTIVAFRWPVLSRFLLNSDESHAIACAQKLAVDPVFWGSIDGTTVGPLVYYPLLLPRLAGLSVEYGSVRVIGLLTLIGSVLLLYGAMRRIFSDGLARLAMLPLVTCISLFTSSHFAHYSSEHVPILLLSLAVYLLARWWTGPAMGSDRALVACGLVLGCLPFAKLQAVPIGLFLACCGVVMIYQRSVRYGRAGWKSLTRFVLSGLALPAFVLLLVFAFGVQHDFWQSYIVNNLGYSDRYLLAGHEGLSLWSKLGMVVDKAFWTFDLSEFVGGTTVFGGLALIFLLATSRSLLREGIGLLGLGVGFLVVAALSVAVPNSLFTHYFLFLLLPITLVTGVWLGLCSEALTERRLGRAVTAARWLVILVFLGLTVIYPLSRRLQWQHPVFVSASTEDAVLRSDLALAVLGFASPGESMVVWGWEPWRYVETGLYPATRDTQTQWQIMDTPQRPYYLERFVRDLQASLPPVFVDTVGYVEGPLPWQKPVFWDRETHAHDVFPGVGAVVDQQYSLVGEVGTARIYVLRQRLREVEALAGRSLERLDEQALLDLAPQLASLRFAAGE